MSAEGYKINPESTGGTIRVSSVWVNSANVLQQIISVADASSGYMQQVRPSGAALIGLEGASVNSFAPGAVPTDSVPLTFLTAEPASGYTFYGEAPPGTGGGSPGWRISRRNKATGDIYYAGSGYFSQTWSNAAAAVYS